MASHHELHPSPDTVHWAFFDAALKPLIEIESGDYSDPAHRFGRA